MLKDPNILSSKFLNLSDNLLPTGLTILPSQLFLKKQPNKLTSFLPQKSHNRSNGTLKFSQLDLAMAEGQFFPSLALYTDIEEAYPLF